MGPMPMTVHISSAVEIAGGNDVRIQLFSPASQTVVAIDRATAARLINQLRRALDSE